MNANWSCDCKQTAV